MLRPALPRRLKHCGKAPTQFCCQKFMSFPGTVGTPKQSVLMYAFGLPGLVRVLHPDPPKRLGKAQSSLLCVSAGSEPVPQVAVNGTPSLAVKIRPSSHPPSVHCAGAEKDFGVGSSQLPSTTRVCPTLKSERPRLSLISNQCKLEMEFPNVSPATEAELVSMLLPHV